MLLSPVLSSVPGAAPVRPTPTASYAHRRLPGWNEDPGSSLRPYRLEVPLHTAHRYCGHSEVYAYVPVPLLHVEGNLSDGCF